MLPPLYQRPSAGRLFSAMRLLPICAIELRFDDDDAIDDDALDPTAMMFGSNEVRQQQRMFAHVERKRH
jgi:hypothetical protein